MLTFGSLFAGIGGMDLGLERAGLECVWQVEVNEWCRRVLRKHWPAVRRHDDVRTFPPTDAAEWRCDIIAGGFPCQDISAAGRRAGLAGERSGLWYEFARIIGVVRPRLVLVENVTALLHRGMGTVLGDLASLGYDAEWHCVPAAAFGAPHIRDRVFILAHAAGVRREAHPAITRGPGEGEVHRGVPQLARDGGWASESPVRGVGDGLPHWVDRIAGLGNAVVPQVAEWVGRRIKEAFPMETESERLLRETRASAGFHAGNGHQPKDDGEPNALTADDVAGIDDLEKAGAGVKWLWEGWLATQVVCALAAKGGLGKTRFVCDLMRRVRHGLPWPDGQEMTLPPDSKALWVVADNHHDQMVTICKAWGISENVKVNSWKKDPYEGTSLENESDFKALDVRAQLVKPVLIVVDTVGNATDRSMSKQEDARYFYTPLMTMARKRKCCVLALTHLNVTGQVLGRRATEKVRVLSIMDKPDPNDKRLRLYVDKTFDKTPAAMGVTLTDAGYEFDATPPVPVEPAEPGQPGYGQPSAPQTGPGRPQGEAVAWLLKRLEKGPARCPTVITEAELLGYDKKLLWQAARRGVVQKYGGEGDMWFRLPPGEQPEEEFDPFPGPP